MDPAQHRIMQELSAISPSDRTDRTVTLNGADVRMRYSPEPGVDLRAESSDPEEPGVVVVSTVYDAGATRPPSYPPELPFLPGLKASVMTVPGGASPIVSWLMVPDVETAAAEILAQSTAAGWKEAPDAGGPVHPGLRVVELTRSGACRSVTVTSFGEGGSLIVSDEPARE